MYDLSYFAAINIRLFLFIYEYCSAQIVRIFLSTPVQLAAKRRKVEKEKGYACYACYASVSLA
jgi:hypothetical protein